MQGQAFQGDMVLYKDKIQLSTCFWGFLTKSVQYNNIWVGMAAPACSDGGSICRNACRNWKE